MNSVVLNMSRDPIQPTDAELAVLEFLWRSGPSSVRVIADALYSGGGNSESATVQKLCERLLAKECVRCDRSTRPRTYEAVIDRSELIEGQLESVADRFCRGAFGPLLSHLVDSRKLSRAEIDSLREQVEELDRARSSKGGGRAKRARRKRGGSS